MDAPTDPAPGGGGNQLQLTNPATNEIQPNYSPDGNRIAFASDENGPAQRQIYSVTSSGGSKTRITNAATDDTHPGYSPDGTRLVLAG